MGTGKKEGGGSSPNFNHLQIISLPSTLFYLFKCFFVEKMGRRKKDKKSVPLSLFLALTLSSCLWLLLYILQIS